MREYPGAARTLSPEVLSKAETIFANMIQTQDKEEKARKEAEKTARERHFLQNIQNAAKRNPLDIDPVQYLK